MAVFERDGFTCQECGATKIFLNADHIKPWATHPDLRYDVDNGRTLCVPCHQATPTWGNKLKRLIAENPELVVGYTKRGRPVLAVAGGADNKTIDNGALSDFTAATDEIGGVDYQRVKLVDGTDGSTAEIQGTAANGLEVDVTRIAAGAKIQLTDGTSDATVRNLAANDALNVAIVDGSGAQVTSFGGSGGTSSTDNSAFTAGTTAETPMAGFYQVTPSAVTDGRSAAIGIDDQRRVKVVVDASTLDVAHDVPDASNPVKTGARGINAFPTAVANNDRTNNVSDLFGRLLTAHIDPAQQVWKSANYTTTQAGAIIWDPTSGKRIAITSIVIGSYGTTAARLILWFGANGDTAYTAGTDQLILAASYAPSATSKPGTVFTPASPIFCTTADFELHATTDAALSVDIAVNGYEF
jgi:hypothetical protein